MSATTIEQSPVERVRLHITPFNPLLADRILAPSVKSLASNISFHAEQAFPDRGFGYVELPVMEAKKLKAKLNGSTLKGSKMRIEDAKPDRKRKVEVDEGNDEDEVVRKKARKEKRKSKENVIDGHELEEGRRVKRGWTGDDSRDDKAKKSKKEKEHVRVDSAIEDDEGRKLRFKTSIPPNAMPLPEKSGSKSKKESKEARRERKQEKVVVEEFKRTKKSRDINMGDKASSHGAVTYEDGKGWVNASGAVVEAERPSKKTKKRRHAKDDGHDDTPVVVAHDEAQTNINKDFDAVSPVEPEAESPGAESPDAESPDAEESEVEEPEAVREDSSALNVQTIVGPQAVQSEHSDDDQAMAGAQQHEQYQDIDKEVHPLEALFKRPTPSTSDSTKSKPKPGPIDTSFSFFDANAAEEEDDTITDLPPQTPHTRRDLEWRSIRSAAPTPDTAAIGRKFSFPFARTAKAEHEDEDEDGYAYEYENAREDDPDVEMEENESAVPSGAKDFGQGREGESTFRKWFYEHRGDFNRGWKKRRREEKKSKRQRENRRLNQKIA